MSLEVGWTNQQPIEPYCKPCSVASFVICEHYYGGERGESGPYLRCPQCDEDTETKPQPKPRTLRILKMHTHDRDEFPDSILADNIPEHEKRAADTMCRALNESGRIGAWVYKVVDSNYRLIGAL